MYAYEGGVAVGCCEAGASGVSAHCVGIVLVAACIEVDRSESPRGIDVAIRVVTKAENAASPGAACVPKHGDDGITVKCFAGQIKIGKGSDPEFLGNRGVEFDDEDISCATQAIRHRDERRNSPSKFLPVIVAKADGESDGWGEMVCEEDMLGCDEGELSAGRSIADAGVEAGVVVGSCIWGGDTISCDKAVVTCGRVRADLKGL